MLRHWKIFTNNEVIWCGLKFSFGCLGYCVWGDCKVLELCRCLCYLCELFLSRIFVCNFFHQVIGWYLSGIFYPLSKISKLNVKNSRRQRSRPNSAKLQSSSSRSLHERFQHTKCGSLPVSRSSSRSSSPQPGTKDKQNTTADQNVEVRMLFDLL